MEPTEGSQQTQAQADKSYSQKEVDDMMARMKSSLQKKLLKPYEDLGDPEDLRRMKSEFEQKQQDLALKRGEFDKVIQDLAAKKDAEIQKRDAIIKDYKVNMPLLTAAAQFKAVAPEQVKALLSNQVRLNDQGDVEVVDDKGAVRYSDAGKPIGVEDLVKDFLSNNPHFVQPTPATTNTKSSYASNGAGVDISKLDMKRPEHRKLFAEARGKAKAR